jgi:hypothetical protein
VRGPGDNFVGAERNDRVGIRTTGAAILGRWYLAAKKKKGERCKSDYQ